MSNPPPLKRALLIGCNYTGTRAALKGCHNDVENVKAFLLTKMGYKPENVKVLVDKPGSDGTPTKANILGAVTMFSEGLRPGDYLWLHYSGHGGQIKDTSGDELDGLDECLIPVDYQEKGVIIDDDWDFRLFKRLPNGVHLTVVFDCCHSGSGMDLPLSVPPKKEQASPVAFGLPYAERALPKEPVPTRAVFEEHKKKHHEKQAAKRAEKLKKWNEKKATKLKQHEDKQKAREAKLEAKVKALGGPNNPSAQKAIARAKEREERKKQRDARKDARNKQKDEKKKEKEEKKKAKGNKKNDSDSDSDSDSDDEPQTFIPLQGLPPVDESQARFIGAIYTTVVSWIKPSGGYTATTTPPLAVPAPLPPAPAKPVTSTPTPVVASTPAPSSAPAPAPVKPAAAPAPTPAAPTPAPTPVVAVTTAVPAPNLANQPATIVLLSGCKDEQCSADTTVGGVSYGALTNAFLEVLKAKDCKISYTDLLYTIRDKLAGSQSIEQTPQMSYNRTDFDAFQQFDG